MTLFFRTKHRIYEVRAIDAECIGIFDPQGKPVAEDRRLIGDFVRLVGIGAMKGESHHVRNWKMLPAASFKLEFDSRKGEFDSKPVLGVSTEKPTFQPEDSGLQESIEP